MFGVSVLKVKISFDTNAQDTDVLLNEVADLYDALTILKAHDWNNGYEVYIEAFDSAIVDAEPVAQPVKPIEKPSTFVLNVKPYDFTATPLAHDLSDLDVDTRLIK
jgi:hypothetical protein